MGSSTICLLLLLSIFVGKSKDDLVDQDENENASSLAFSSTRSTTTFRLFEWILSRLLWMSQQSAWLRCQSRLDLDALETLRCTRWRQMCQNHRTFSRWYRIDHSLLNIHENRFFSGEINYVRGCINQIEAVRPEMPTVRENGCWTATDNYIVRIHAELDLTRIDISVLFFRAWHIDHGMCKRTSLSIVSVTNEMVAIQLDVHWPIIPTFSSCVCSLSLPESVLRLMYCFFFSCAICKYFFTPSMCSFLSYIPILPCRLIWVSSTFCLYHMFRGDVCWSKQTRDKCGFFNDFNKNNSI